MQSDIVNDIIELIENSTNNIDKGKSDSEWTKYIKRQLINIGDKYNYKTCTSGVEGADTEWLYDLVWYKSNHEKNLEHISLIVECEWLRTLDDIRYDFEKLLLANCNLKLMICQDGRETLDNLKAYFSKSIRAFKNITNDCIYMVAIFENDKYLFKVIKYDNKGALI
jgi:hypothetical protein